jgi:hypothetical protein
MDASALADYVTSVVMGLVDEVGGGLGAAAAARVNRVVRERLGLDEDGRRVLERLDGDPGAGGDLRARLLTLIEEDPEFAAQVREATGRPEIRSGWNNQSVNIGGNVKKGVIAFGPVSIRKDSGALAALVVVVVVLAFAVNGAVRLFDADGRTAGSTGATPGPISATSGRTSAASGPGTPGHTATAVKDPALARAIAPDLAAMPSGWGPTDTATLDPCTDSDCHGVLAYGSASFADSSGDTHVDFTYATYDSVQSASAAFQQLVAAAQSAAGATSSADDPVTAMSLDQVGDGSAAFASRHYTGSEYTYKASVCLHVGTVTGRVNFASGYQKVNTDTLLLFARLLAGRAQQAQDGQMPSARANP